MATTEIERLLVRLVGDATSYQKMLKDAEASSKRAAATVQTAGIKMQAIATRLKAVGASMRRVGRSMSLAITAPLTIIGGLSVRSFAKFDQAMTESTSIMKVTEEQMRSMRRTALELSGSGKALQGPTSLAESYFFLASAGKSAEQSMSLLPKVSKFATAGAFDMALATDLLTDAQSALGLTSKNVAEDTENLVRVSDVLVKANTLANASVQQFATALTTKAGAALKVYNKDVEEGVAVLAALADQGVKSQLAGNALDRVMRLAAKGALDNAKAHAELGFRVFDETGKMRNLGDIIANLEDVLRGMSDETRAATLDMLGFEARVQGVILPLIGTSDAIKQYEVDLRKAKGITEEVANKQMKSFSNQMKVLKNQLSIVGMEIGEALIPAIKALAGALKTGIDAWHGLSDGAKQFIVTTGLVVASIGPLLIALGAVVSLAGVAVGALGGLAAVAGVLTGPVGLGALVIGGGAFVASKLLSGGDEVAKAKSRRQIEDEKRNAIVRAHNAEVAAKKAAREAAKQQKLIDSTIGGRTPEAIRSANEAAKKTLAEHKKIMEEGARITEQFLTPQETFTKKQEELSRLLKAGAISAQTYARGLAEAKEELRGVNKEIEKSRALVGIQAVAIGSSEALARQAAHELRIKQGAFGAPARRVPPPLGRARDVLNAGAAGLTEDDKTLALIERIVNATETMAGKPSFDEVAESAELN